MIRFLRRVLIFLIVLMAGTWLVFQSETIQQKSAAKLKELFFNATGMYIQMDALTFSFPNTLTAYKFQVADQANRLWLEVDQADFTFDIAHLLNWETAKFTIDGQHAKLYFIPQFLNSNDNQNVQLPEIALNISELEIGPDVYNDSDLPLKLYTVRLQNMHFLTTTQQLMADLYAEAEMQDSPINIQAAFLRLQNGTIQADFKAIYDAFLPINGKLNLSANYHLDGTTFQIPMTDIGTLAQLQGSEGQMQIEGNLYGHATAPLIDLEIQAPFLAIKDFECHDLFSRIITHASKEQVSGQIHCSSLVANKHLIFDADFNRSSEDMLTISASEFHFDNLTLDRLVLEAARQASESYSFYINGDGDWKQTPVAFKGKGLWHPAHLTVDAFLLKMAECQALGSLSYSSEEIKGACNVQNFPLESLPLQNTEGVISLKASISGNPGNPKIQLAAISHGLHSGEDHFAKLNPAKSEFNGTIENHLFLGKGSLSIPHMPSITFQIGFPFTFSIQPLNVALDLASPLKGHFAVEGEIAEILHPFLDSPTSFSGNAKIDLFLAGTWQEPQHSGKVVLSKGSYEIPEIGVLLKDITGQADIQGSRLLIKQISGNDGKVGQVQGNGYYELGSENPFLLDLKLQNVAFLSQDHVKIIGNGPLILKGNSQEGLLTGQLEALDASINIPDRSRTTINTVEVTYINIPKDSDQLQVSIPKKTTWPLMLDVQLNIPRSMTIQGKDLISYWKGSIAVKGKGSAPLLFGELRLSDGQYLFNGKPFALNQGFINFAGEFDKKTTLYVIAEKDLEKVKVDVIAKGPVKNPEISFRSNPPMPQREILSWLLFNRGTSQISPFQGAQLSESITNLSTNQQEPDVLSKIRSLLKIDRFEIGRSPNNDSSGVNLEVGKYISDNILISVIKSDVNRVAIEADLTERIKLQGQVGDDSQGKIFLKWKRDY